MSTIRSLVGIVGVALSVVAYPGSAPAQAPDNDATGAPLNGPGTPLGAYVFEDTNVGATPVGGALECASPRGVVLYGTDVFYTFYPHVNGRVSLIVELSNSAPFNGVIGLTPSNADGSPNFAAETCRDEATNQLEAIHDYPVTAGQKYWAYVGGFQGQAGNFNFSFLFEADPDSDGVFDAADACPTTAGPGQVNGCPPTPPPPDSDGDGLIDAKDKCPRTPNQGRDSSPRDGCPDPIRLRARSRLLWTATTGGVKIDSITVQRAPKGARVYVRCGRVCRRTSRRSTGRTVRFAALRGRRLRAGTKLDVIVTAPGAIGIYTRYMVGRGRATPKEYCTLAGTARLRKCT